MDLCQAVCIDWVPGSRTRTISAEAMQHGNLANKASPKVLLIFEGALGSLSSRHAAYFKKLARKENWHDAAAVWELNKLMMRQINHISWQSNFNVEVITYVAGQDFAAAMEERFASFNLSISTVSYYTSAVELSNQMPYELNILAVYDPDAMRSMTYGAKGRHLTSAHQLGV